jgi:DNA polymerase III alpha subunit
LDIDIDTQTTFDPFQCFDAVPASMIKNGLITKHPVGVYFQNIPIDPITQLSSIPYQAAEELGYFKIDMLHLSVLDYFNNKGEIRMLTKKPPDWDLLLSPSVVSKLFQLSNHYDLVVTIKPKSIIELADCIALIRPGKRYLLDGYLKDKDVIRQELYKKTDKYYFKRAHAISYATTIVLQLHLIKGGVI